MPANESEGIGDQFDAAISGEVGVSTTALELFASDPGVVGRLVRSYRAQRSANSAAWVDSSFEALVHDFFAGTIAALLGEDGAVRLPEVVNGRTDSASGNLTGRATRLLSLRPNYFRGFLTLPHAIDLRGQLVVIYGRNSSGKTSLAEAIEWLFSGTLARRAMGESGNARELEGCVGNQFRPDGEVTWVEATFGVGATELTLRRTLVADFGATKTSKCRSTLECDGAQLSELEAADLFNRLFAGVAPLLMQHTLRSFVNSSPPERRNYFERLLRLDDLTHLIEKAVVSDVRLPEFRSPTGSIAFGKWLKASGLTSAAQPRALVRSVIRGQSSRLVERVREALGAIATAEFRAHVGSETDVALQTSAIAAIQSLARQRSFAQLQVLRPRRLADESASTELDSRTVTAAFESFVAASRRLEGVRAAAQTVSGAQLIIAKAFGALDAAGLIVNGSDSQTCPICESVPPSLTGDRVALVRTWEPVQSALERAEKDVAESASALRTRLQNVWKIRADVLPKFPDTNAWDAAIANTAPLVSAPAIAAHSALTAALTALDEFDRTLVRVGKALASDPISASTLEAVRTSQGIIDGALPKILDEAKRYRSALDELERAVGVQAKDDPDYARRETWIGAAADIPAIAVDLRWETAKQSAQSVVEAGRDFLIDVRQQLLEGRRIAFSEGMTEVWNLLRKDTFARFSSLHIPPPRGRGFPVEIEVKAEIQGPAGSRTVDALRVFSESQIHVLGIAAFVTRSAMVGHRILIFDDPVQSMDEDHFKALAGPFAQHLLAQGYQIIVLTHNQTFEKDISYVHYDFEHYTTLSVTHTRKYGCRITEGNRRVTERLDRAERKMGSGDPTNAWILVRRAIERLYALVYCKYGPPGFDPRSWTSQTAEAMWNAGVGKLIVERAPESAQSLKSILGMSAGAAHDGEQSGESDLITSVQYVRSLLSKLAIGG